MMGKENLKRTSFKTKMLIPVIAVFVTSVMIISVMNYRLLDSAVRTKTKGNLELFTNSILTQTKHLDIILEAATKTLNDKNITIAKSIAYILENTSLEMTGDECRKLAALLDIIEFDIADSKGIITNSNFDDYIDFDYNSTESTSVYMRLAEGAITTLGEEPRKDEISGNITHYAGVSRTDDIGFIQLGFDANILKKIQEDISIQIWIEETKIGDNGFGMVLSNGMIKAHPNKDILGMEISTEEWYNTVVSGKGFEWVDIDNIRYYAGFTNIDGDTVIGLVPEADYYKELHQALIDTVIFMTAAIILMIAVVYLILGKLLAPVRNLSDGLEKISKGDLDTRIEGNYNDEFDIIKDAVNSMVVGIKSYISDKMEAEHAAHESELAKIRAEAAREAIISSLNYAYKIQSNMLPVSDVFDDAFAQYSIIWKPKDIVGGDIYWIKNYDEGTVLCVCDCTGHGTPGALLSMLVVSALEAVVNPQNCSDTAEIIWQLEQRLVTVFSLKSSERELSNIEIKDGCDLAAIFIARDGSATLSAGNTNVFVCDGTEVRRIKGQRIYVGEGQLESKDNVKTVYISANPDNKFYVASDGLFDQPGGKQSAPFGYKRFGEIILEHHGENQSVISSRIWEAFEAYRGEELRVDDFELITFKP